MVVVLLQKSPHRCLWHEAISLGPFFVLVEFPAVFLPEPGAGGGGGWFMYRLGVIILSSATCGFSKSGAAFFLAVVFSLSIDHGILAWTRSVGRLFDCFPWGLL